MNIVLWVFQALLALHTAMGAIWKFTNPAQNVPSLNAIPPSVWTGLIGFELLCAVGLILPAFYRPFPHIVSLAAAGIALEMVAFCVIHLMSGSSDNGPMIYWLVVIAVCTAIAWARYSLRPL